MCSGCVSAAPSATSITTPSVIIALLSATIGSELPDVEQLRLQRGIAGFQHLAQRADANARFEPGRHRTVSARTTPSTSTSRRAPAIACSFERGAGARQRRRIRRRRQRQHLAHQHAQIGIFPVLDPPMRQARALVSLERLPARIGDLARAGQPVPRDGEDIAQRASGFGFRQYNVHHQIRFSVRPRLRTARSRKPRAPAPVPCRRF